MLFIEKTWTQFTEPFLIILPICDISRYSLGFLRSINLDCNILKISAHHLLAAFTHKSSVTVAELRDYITRRKNKKSQ